MSNRGIKASAWIKYENIYEKSELRERKGNF